MQVVYPLGEIIDPITGKPCAAGKFKEHQEEIRQISTTGKFSNVSDEQYIEENNLENISHTVLDDTVSKKDS